MTTYAPDSDALTNGRWERQGWKMVWIPADPVDWEAYRKTEPETHDPRTWSQERVNRAHAAYIRGERDSRTEVGHREWMRRWKVEYRARKRAEQESQDVG